MAVFVAGSMNMDVVAFAPRLPAPGETLTGTKVEYFPGGKGLNPAVAVARQGVPVHMIARLGDDGFGEDLSQFAAENGIDLTYVRKFTGVQTGCAVIMVAEGGENSIVVIPGANGRVSSEHVLEPDFSPPDVLLSVFEIPLPTVKSFLEKGRLQGARTILSPAPAKECDFLDLPDIIVLNETELAFYTRSDSMPEDGARMLIGRPDQTVVVTLGVEGSIAVSHDGVVRVEARRVDAVDATGAGDCFVGCLAASLSAGEDLEASLRYANAAASICVTRKGAAPSMPLGSEVISLLEEMRGKGNAD